MNINFRTIILERLFTCCIEHMTDITEYNVYKWSVTYTNNWCCNLLLLQYWLATFSLCPTSDLCCGTVSVCSVPIRQHVYQQALSYCNNMLTAASVWSDCRLETLTILLGQTVGKCWETTDRSDRVQCSRWHKEFEFFTSLSAVCPDCRAVSCRVVSCRVGSPPM